MSTLKASFDNGRPVARPPDDSRTSFLAPGPAKQRVCTGSVGDG